MAEEDWDGLPLETLAAVSRGKDELKAMRGVCKRWQAGFECSVTGIRVPWHGPQLPNGAVMAARFPFLTSLRLGNSFLNNSGLRELSSLRRLASVSLRRRGPATEAGLAFRQIFQSQQPDTGFTDYGLNALRVLPLTHLDLHGCQQVRALQQILANLCLWNKVFRA